MAVWDDTRVKPHVRAAAKEISQTFGVTDIGGYSYRDIAGTNTLSDHAKGLALDVMGAVKGQQIANWAVQNAARLSITYVIWNRQYWDAKGGWVPYKGVNPHTDHVHISFSPQPGDGSQSFAPGEMPSSGNVGCLSMLSGIGLLILALKGKVK